MFKKHKYQIFFILLGLLCCVALGEFFYLNRSEGHTLASQRENIPPAPVSASPVEAEEVFQNLPVATTSSSTSAIRVPILIYHSVLPDHKGETKQQEAFTVTPDMLNEQFAYLKDHGFTVISMDQFSDDLKRGTTSPVTKPVVITFDDGWKNQYQNALPLLKKYGYTATFFVYTNPIGKYPVFMSWSNIKELIASGMTIGDHTLSHPYLSKLSPKELEHEVVDARKALESNLGITVRHFASPFGYTSPALVELLRKENFETGRTTYKGTQHTEDSRLALTGYLVKRDMKDFAWFLEYMK